MGFQDFLQVARRHIIDCLECQGSYPVVNTFMVGASNEPLRETQGVLILFSFFL